MKIEVEELDEAEIMGTLSCNVLEPGTIEYIIYISLKMYKKSP